MLRIQWYHPLHPCRRNLTFRVSYEQQNQIIPDYFTYNGNSLKPYVHEVGEALKPLRVACRETLLSEILLQV